MLEVKLLAFLRCPEDRSELKPAGKRLVREINSAIRAGRLCNRTGRTLDQTIDGGLIRTRGDMLYPIVQQIPILLRDEAIPLNQVRPPVNNS